MEHTYTISTAINRPAHDVFEALLDPQKLVHYFADRVSGRLEPGARITWSWSEWGDYPVVVDEVIPDRRIVLRLDTVDWKKSKSDAYDITVTIELESLDSGRTMLRISESGWKRDADGLRGSYDNCGGWQHMALCLKAWIEHDIDLR